LLLILPLSIYPVYLRQKMKNYGLIGFPLSHSFSKKYFTEKFIAEKITDAAYDLYPLENIDELPGLLHANPNLCGLNVTIPTKWV
jgi:shikimate dehydrogenase